MAYTDVFDIDLGTEGLTLKAALQTGSTIHATVRDITTGMVELGQGYYQWLYTSLPDGYQGTAVFYTGTIGAGTDLTGVTVYATAPVGPTIADVTQISGDATAASNLEAILDGTGGVTLSLGAVAVSGTTTLTGAVSLGSTLGITGATTFTGAVSMGSTLTLTGAVTATNASNDIRGVKISGTITTLDALDTALDSAHGAGSWESSGAGSGANAIVVTVTDGTNPLQNATVRVTEGVNSFTAITDASGNASFSLDDGDYEVSITKGGYSFTPETRNVSGSGGTIEDDLEMTVIVVSPPVDPTLALLYGTLYDSDGELASNVKVVATLVSPGNRPVKNTGGLVVGRRSEEITDASGEFEMELTGTDEMTPTGCRYTITCEDANLDKRNVEIAAGSTVDIDTLV
jgi:hypothetical protein